MLSEDVSLAAAWRGPGTQNPGELSEDSSLRGQRAGAGAVVLVRGAARMGRVLDCA